MFASFAGPAPSSPSLDDADAESEGDLERLLFLSRPFERFESFRASELFGRSAFAVSAAGGTSRSGDGDGLGVLAHMNCVLASFSRFKRRKSA